MVKASDSVGILCLSKANDNLLMWSHYSDSHKGVCIEYATSDKKLFGCGLTKVRYSKKYPRFAATKGFDLKTTRRYLSTKSSHWKHEREWRIFYHGLGVQTFPGKELSAVYLGCAILPEDRDEIIEVVRQRPTKARVYQASLDSESFRLRMEPLDTQTPTR